MSEIKKLTKEQREILEEKLAVIAMKLQDNGIDINSEEGKRYTSIEKYLFIMRPDSSLRMQISELTNWKKTNFRCPCGGRHEVVKKNGKKILGCKDIGIYVKAKSIDYLFWKFIIEAVEELERKGYFR